MSSLNDFFTPRMVGKRFDKHSIPLELLKELAVLEEMLFEVAKWCYLQEHPERQRTPKGFAEGVSLNLTAVREGSAVPSIALDMPPSDLVQPYNLVFFEQARDKIIGAIAAAQAKADAAQFLPRSLLGYFDRLGRGLRDQEHIEFSPSTPDRPARLSKETRKYLVNYSTVREVTEEVCLRGTIPGADQSRMTFKFQPIGRKPLEMPLPEQHLETVMQGFNEYRQGGKVLLQGIGRFSRDGRLLGIEAVEHLSVLDARDVAARLEEFKGIKAGWLDGSHGVSLSEEGLDWLAAQFDKYYPEELSLPYLYPTAEGGVQAEWCVGNWEVTLEIDLYSHNGEWHALNISNDQEDEKVINLKEEASWRELAEQIRTLGQTDDE